MNLRLEIIKAAEGSDLLDAVVDVDMNGLSIGRALNNDLVLKNDPSISKQHAVIQYQHGDFYIYDISTNGVYLSDNLQALNTQENNFQLLKNDDSIRIGAYILQVDLGEQRETLHEVDLESLMTKNARGTPLLAEEEDSAEEHFLYGAQRGEGKFLKDAPEEFDLDGFLRGESLEYTADKELKAVPQDSTDLIADLLPPPEVKPLLPDILDLMEGLTPDFSVKDFAPLTSSKQTYALPAGETEEASFHDKGEGAHLLTLLFDELGLGDYKMDLAKQTAVIGQLVTLIKTTLQCMHDSVQRRQESLQALGLTPISYKKTGNNPILFSATVDEALSKLLFPPKGEVYLTTEEAIPQCFADLENYQYYLALAAKETLQQTLDQFSPKAVAKVLCDVEVKRGFFKRKSLINFNQYTAYFEKINAQSDGQLNRIMQKNVQTLPNPKFTGKQ
jgi:type VI secretion system FHA domain protein